MFILLSVTWKQVLHSQASLENTSRMSKQKNRMSSSTSTSIASNTSAATGGPVMTTARTTTTSTTTSSSEENSTTTTVTSTMTTSAGTSIVVLSDGSSGTINSHENHEKKKQKHKKKLRENLRSRYSSSSTTTSSSASTSRPNILMIVADDVGTSDVTGYWGDNIVDMPHLERLQEMGVTFLDAHASPVCAPSRYMILSGNYPHRGTKAQGSWQFNDGHSQFLSTQRSIAQVLKEGSGYHTAMFGKWHVGLGVPLGKAYNATYALTGGRRRQQGGSRPVQEAQEILGEQENDMMDDDWCWNHPVMDGPNDFGFDSTYFTAASVGKGPYAFFRNGYLETKQWDVVFWDKGEHNTTHQKNGVFKIRNPCEGDKNWDSSAYNMILVNETLKFLDDHLEERPSSPFFAYVALGNVHMPHSPPLRYLDGSPILGQYNSSHLDLLLEMDKVVGSLIGAVEEKGIANNTIFIFTSDNGGLNMNYPNQTLRGHKNTIWEGGHRVPLVLRYDGIFPRGERRGDQFVGLNDLYATLAEILDIPVPLGSAQDSVSFAKSILQSQTNNNTRYNDLQRDYLATFSIWMGKFKGQAIRHGDFKLVETFNKKNGFIEERSLYNLKTDLQETTNIIDLPQHKDMVDRMLVELKKVGLCPEDHVGEFSLMNSTQVTCQWFEQHPEECQKEAVAGELNCNSICGRHHAYCTRK